MLLYPESAPFRFRLLQIVATPIHILNRKLQFSDLPEKWITLRKTAMNIKYKIVAIQTYQVDMIFKRITYHNQQTHHFRDMFQKIEVHTLHQDNFILQ